MRANPQAPSESGDSTSTLAGTRSSVLASPGFEEEAREYLRGRLLRMTGVLSLLLGLLSLAFIVALTQQRGVSLLGALIVFCTQFPNSALFGMAATSAVLHLGVRFLRLNSIGLAVVDGLFLQTLIVPCLILYAALHTFSFSGFAYVVPFLVLFILGRAILTPSTAVRTTLLSLPAPVGVLAIQLANGESYAFPGQPYSSAHFLDTVIQNQVCLVGAVAVAAIASKVNLGLRRRTYDAKRIGQYELKKRIGEGAMGAVFEARHSLMKRPTAIKFLRPELSSRRMLKRFEREVRHNSRLSHPNTVRIYDYGRTAEGVFYYAMELLEGASLRQIVESTGPMPASRAIHALVQACGALKEAHDKGILHRDIKPANMMLCEQGGERDVLKLLDFGLARELEAAEKTPASIEGTPETMAPEVIAGQGVTASADLYALCVSGYYLVTGRPVFQASSVPELLALHRFEQPIPPSRRNTDIPSDLEAVLLKGLRKDSTERFADAIEMRNELLDCADAGSWTSKDATVWWEEFDPGKTLLDTFRPDSSDTSARTQL